MRKKKLEKTDMDLFITIMQNRIFCFRFSYHINKEEKIKINIMRHISKAQIAHDIKLQRKKLNGNFNFYFNRKNLIYHDI